MFFETNELTARGVVKSLSQIITERDDLKCHILTVEAEGREIKCVEYVGKQESSIIKSKQLCIGDFIEVYGKVNYKEELSYEISIKEIELIKLACKKEI